MTARYIVPASLSIQKSYEHVYIEVWRSWSKRGSVAPFPRTTYSLIRLSGEKHSLSSSASRTYVHTLCTFSSDHLHFVRNGDTLVTFRLKDTRRANDRRACLRLPPPWKRLSHQRLYHASNLSVKAVIADSL